MSNVLPSQRRLSRGVMAAYGFGAVAYGVKDSGFGTFLLLFYNQVIGLSSTTVGLVIMAALLIDAFVDPAVGFYSDRTRTRWGRRHPWMYASVLPIMAGWLLLWNPPGGATATTLIWLFACAVVVRSAVSAYEVPSVALTPELSTDYDERTRIMAWRYLFGWAGGLAIGLAVYLYFLAPTQDYPNGLLRRAGYQPFALAGALSMGAAILVSALGTHHEIPNLPNPPVVRQTLRESFRELRETTRNRAFAILMAAGLAAYTMQGVAYALSNFLNIYVWGFKGMQLVAITCASFVGVLIAFGLASTLGRRGDKGRTAMVAVLLGAAFASTPYWLRFAGLYPVQGSPALLPTYMVTAVLSIACNVTGFILGASMMADVVEDSESRTGRRSEGVFFAGSFFVQKCTSGIGIFLAGLILGAAGFPAKAVPGHVPLAAVDRLTLIYSCTYLAMACVSAFFFARFPFGRAEHEARLARLAGDPAVDAAPRQPA
ncbi:MFS transporter [uncultured Sphingomonas sp.]|uniref:MFS transporter n=1 Tax=uncultured Sphingomonas sp. TaxID=158754 RepID=UPI0035CC9CF4